MRTELIAKVSYGTQALRFERSTLTKSEETKGKVLHYAPAHQARGSRTNPRTGVYGEGTWHEPEAVYTSNHGFRPKNGKLNEIRRMPEEAVLALVELDLRREDLQRQINDLYKKEREILAAVYEKSVPLRMHEVRGFKA